MNYATLETLRNLMGHLMKGDLQTLIESLQYSPPVRPNPQTGARQPYLNPILTGIRPGTGKVQERQLQGGASGAGQSSNGAMTGSPAGQARGGT
jgi:hypothetical protein